MPTLREILIAPPAGGVLGNVVARLDTALRIVCAVILWLTFLALFVPTLANAVLRYATDISLVWSVEIAQLCFPWFIVAGAALAAQHGRHICVEALLNILPERIGRLLRGAAQGLILMACVALIYVYNGWGMFEGGMKFAAGDVEFTSLGVAQSWSYLALLVGYVLLGLTALSSGYRLFRPGDRETTCH